MIVNLTKGVKVDLTKNNASLKNIAFGASWDAADPTRPSADVDISALLFTEAEEPIKFVYFNDLTAPGITHMGDSLTGDGDGDDETIKITLPDIPAQVAKIACYVTIFDKVAKGQNFGQIKNLKTRIYNDDDKTVLAILDLNEDYSGSGTIHVGDFYRHDGEWKFNAVAEATVKEMDEVLRDFGVQVAG